MPNMRYTIPLFLVLIVSCSQQASKTKDVNNQSVIESSKQERIKSETNIKKSTFNYSSIIENFPVISSLDIDFEQLQKSRYTKVHPQRNLNNFYFELKELTLAEREVVDINDIEKSRCFYFGQFKTRDLLIVVILKNDTTDKFKIDDTYIAQVLDSGNSLLRTFELAKITSPDVEEATETTSKQIDDKIIRTTIYELYDSPIDEEPMTRIENKETISINDKRSSI